MKYATKKQLMKSLEVCKRNKDKCYAMIASFDQTKGEEPEPWLYHQAFELENDALEIELALKGEIKLTEEDILYFLCSY